PSRRMARCFTTAGRLISNREATSAIEAGSRARSRRMRRRVGAARARETGWGRASAGGRAGAGMGNPFGFNFSMTFWFHVKRTLRGSGLLGRFLVGAALVEGHVSRLAVGGFGESQLGVDRLEKEVGWALGVEREFRLAGRLREQRAVFQRDSDLEV